MTETRAASENVREVAENIYSIRLPMPFGLDHINTYLIKENNRLALVDCGLDLPESWEALNSAFAHLGIPMSELTDIFVTHGHPDHIGQLPRLRRVSPEARLFLHKQEYKLLSDRADQANALGHIQEWLDRNGANDLSAQMLVGTANDLVPRLQNGDTLLNGGEQLKLAPEPSDATGEWQVMWTPGHTVGHFVLYNPQRGLLLSGDHLLNSISSNIGKYPGSTEDPLGDFIASLEAISALNVNQVLPAHGKTFSNHRQRIKDLIGHHRVRLGKIYATLEHGPRTPAEVVQAIWADRATGFHRYLALVEALSHLERLHREGKVTLEEDKGVVRYRAA
ncbi:MAG TPA: MBL fold metallo-hydrolase [Chloroflexia bacterium]|nr:MBL fold metallo-hydrolase [Chloroflexia bacterium]